VSAVPRLEDAGARRGGDEHRGGFEPDRPDASVLITADFSSLFLLAMSGLVVPPM